MTSTDAPTTSVTRAAGLEAVKLALDTGLAHGPRLGVSRSVQRSLPPLLPRDLEAPGVIHTLVEIRRFAHQLDELYAQNPLMPDVGALVQPIRDGDRWDQPWWRKYRLGWIARRWVINGGQGVLQRGVQTLICDSSPYAAPDLAILHADICRFTARSRKIDGMRAWLEFVRGLPSGLLRAAARHLCGWLGPDREADFILWMREAGRDFAQEQKDELSALRRSPAGGNPEEQPVQDDFDDGWPTRPVAAGEAGVLALMNALDYSGIYTTPQLVEMALYHPDRSVAARSLYALVDLGRRGITSGGKEDRCIRQFLLSPFGPGWVRRIGARPDLLRRLSEHLTYHRAIHDASWAEACSILCKFSRRPLLPLPAQERLSNLPEVRSWAQPHTPDKEKRID